MDAQLMSTKLLGNGNKSTWRRFGVNATCYINFFIQNHLLRPRKHMQYIENTLCLRPEEQYIYTYTDNL